MNEVTITQNKLIFAGMRYHVLFSVQSFCLHEISDRDLYKHKHADTFKLGWRYTYYMSLPEAVMYIL
jgi:hypothetical protein